MDKDRCVKQTAVGRVSGIFIVCHHLISLLRLAVFVDPTIDIEDLSAGKSSARAVMAVEIKSGGLMDQKHYPRPLANLSADFCLFMKLQVIRFLSES